MIPSIPPLPPRLLPRLLLHFLLSMSLFATAANGWAAPATDDAMAQRTRACTACHGAQGIAGPDGYYPRLAGKPVGYLYHQLLNFSRGRRHYAPMTGLLDNLSDDYLLDVARYFSALDLPYAPPLPVNATASALVRGEQLVRRGDPARELPACQDCHGRALTGAQPSIPGLLGLPADYINAQLGGWQTGQRHAAEPDCMAKVAHLLSDGDISAVARWLAGQPVPHDARAPIPPNNRAALLRQYRCGSTSDSMATLPAPALVSAPASAALPTRGAYLARIGNCAHCHTPRGGAAFGGGRAIDTPYGVVYSSNLTPDRTRGIGAWTADDFWQALHSGVSRDGHLLSPAFPYTSFTHVTRSDSDALFAYLQTLEPATTQNQPSTLEWPYNTQWALWLWRQWYFTPDDAQHPTTRGAYLVQGLGHCLECHSARSTLGARRDDDHTLGGVLPGSQWYAPSLQEADQASVAAWSTDAVEHFLRSGTGPTGYASGPMADVVLHGTQYLTHEDAQAVAIYLKQTGTPSAATAVAVPAKSVPMATPRPSEPPVAQAPPQPNSGAQLYVRYCTNCHGSQGQGQPGAYPALAGNRFVTAANTNNLIHMVLSGGFAPATALNTRPWGMPPFLLQMNDTEMAAVLSYIRSAWGNQATAVSTFDVQFQRHAQAH